MPEHTELEVDSVISRQNVAKEGWTTYYVDGANGNDANNGLRWETAFKTIQHAIDVAESWAKIYIKNGTYNENVTIPSSKFSLSLIGESWKSVIITAEDIVLDVVSGSNSFMNLYLKAIGEHYACHATGGRNIFKNCFFETSGSSTYAFALSSDDNLVLHSETSDSVAYGVNLLGCRNEISHCRLFASNTVLKIEECSDDGLFHDCSFFNASAYAVYSGGGSHNLFYHNNFINNTNAVYDNGWNKFLENFYDDHSNIDNGFGIATEPYTFHGGSDPRPVVCRNGWLALGLGTNTIKSVPAAGTYTHPNDTSEHDVLEFTADTQDIFISLDVNALTQKTEVREYEKIDGTNYRQISLKTYPDDFDSGTKAITIYFKQKNKDYKITLKSTVAEGASRDIPYVYRTDGKV